MLDILASIVLMLSVHTTTNAYYFYIFIHSVNQEKTLSFHNLENTVNGCIEYYLKAVNIFFF